MDPQHDYFNKRLRRIAGGQGGVGREAELPGAQSAGGVYRKESPWLIRRFRWPLAFAAGLVAVHVAGNFAANVFPNFDLSFFSEKGEHLAPLSEISPAQAQVGAAMVMTLLLGMVLRTYSLISIAVLCAGFYIGLQYPSEVADATATAQNALGEGDWKDKAERGLTLALDLKDQGFALAMEYGLLPMLEEGGETAAATSELTAPAQ